jgi:phage host-nuclease inhibitor protein Gam
MMGKKSKSLKTQVPAMSVPQNEAEADKYLLQLATDCNSFETVNTEMQGRINEIKSQYGDQLEPKRMSIVTLFRALVSYTNAHRNEITQDGARSKRLPCGGTLGFHKNPPHLAFDESEEELIEFLENNELGDLVETRKSLKINAIKDLLDKEELLVQHFRTESTEDVVVNPPGLDEKADVRKLLKMS